MKRSVLLSPSAWPASRGRLRPTLDEGLKIVAASGRDVKIARSNEEAARGGVSLARAPWLPQVNAYGNETWLRYSPLRAALRRLSHHAQDKFLTYGVTATQLLYDFGQHPPPSTRQSSLSRPGNRNHGARGTGPPSTSSWPTTTCSRRTNC